MSMVSAKVAAWLSEVVIWCLPVTLGLIGLVYVFGDDWRTENAAYDVPKAILPIEAWGLLFLVVAAFEVFVHLQRRVNWMIAAKCLGAGLCLVWAMMLGASLILHADEAPIVFPVLFLTVAFYHLGVVSYLVRTG